MIRLYCKTTDKEENQIIIKSCDDGIDLKCEGCNKTHSHEIGFFAEYFNDEINNFKIRNVIMKELSDSTHNIEHIDRVYKTCLIIAKDYIMVDMKILKTSALLHDIARLKEDLDESRKIDHAILGAEIAEEILIDLNFTYEEIKKIKHCITTHRFRDENKPETLEAKILFDADKIDILGAVGVARSFMYAGAFGERMYADIPIDEYIKDNLEGGKSSGRIKSISTHAPNIEYETKIKKICDRLFTDKGREIAESRICFIDEFFMQLRKELGVLDNDM